MASETSKVRGQNPVQLMLAAAISAGEIWQLPDGRVGRKEGAGGTVGSSAPFNTADIWSVAKASGVTLLDGGRVFWDRSARVATYRKVNDRDCYLGRCVGGAASGDGRATVAFNLDPAYDLDLARDPFLTSIVGTQALGGLGLYRRGGAHHLVLDGTNEAQKVDMLSVDGFDPAANPIVEGAIRIISDGGGVAPDINIGVASGTHTDDADQIAEHLFLHLNGNATDIFVQSKDGTTTMTATDTTINYTEGAAVANRLEFWMDLHDLADCKIYLGAARVLSSTRFRLDAATGPLFLLVHAEKTAGTNTYEVAVDWLRSRHSEQ